MNKVISLDIEKSDTKWASTGFYDRNKESKVIRAIEFIKKLYFHRFIDIN
jgi:hypothetical protein